MQQFFKHFFLPHASNNFRPKLLHNSSIFIFAVLLLVGAFVVRGVHRISPEVLGISYSITELDLLAGTNKARVEQGLAPLSENPKLAAAAQKKAQFMFEKNFWAHFAPDGTSPWTFIKSAGYNYSYAGENLAKGFTNSQDIVSAWLASPSHRENLLSANYKEIGFAIQEGTLQGEDTVLVVQLFASQPGTAAVPQQEVAAVPQAKVQSLAVVPAPQKQAVVTRPVVNSAITTKGIAFGALIIFLILLVIDVLIVNKRKIPRIVGHNLDHIILLAIFLAFLLLEVNGGIL